MNKKQKQAALITVVGTGLGLAINYGLSAALNKVENPGAGTKFCQSQLKFGRKFGVAMNTISLIAALVYYRDR